MRQRDLGDRLAWLCQVEGLPEPVRELRFAPPRRWRFDLAYLAVKLAIEAEGGTWRQGRHNRPEGYAADCEKYNAATLLGWRVLRVTAEHIESGQAVAWIRQALATGATAAAGCRE